MGQSLSCGNSVRQRLVAAIREGDVDLVRQMVDEDAKLLNNCFSYDCQAPLHVAASHGQLQVLSMLLERGANVNPNSLNSSGQTPLMLACKSGRWMCVDPLLEAGANILAFDYSVGRTCLHYACRGGHTECVRRILEGARRGTVSHPWGFVRFVNVRDCSGTTSLHMAARKGHLSVVRLLLDNGALVSATTTAGNGHGHGSAPIHYAARGGSLECVRELLAWGADRTQRDITGYTPFGIAMKYSNTTCAALLNPHAAEPLVWPSPWKFMSESELSPEAKTLLEAALAQANEDREQEIVAYHSRLSASRKCRSRRRKRRTLGSMLAAAAPGRAQAPPPPPPASKSRTVATIPNEEARPIVIPDPPSVSFEEDVIDVGGMDALEVCSICFEHPCTIEVVECGHQMCATCTLSLCCHSKPNPGVPYTRPPCCPFCRRPIEHLILARPKQKVLRDQETEEKPLKPWKSIARRPGESRHDSKDGSDGKSSSFSGSLFGTGRGSSLRLGASDRSADADLLYRW